MRNLVVLSAFLATAACGSSGGGSSKEAQLFLRKIEKSAKEYFVERTGFPVGMSATLPEKPCCGQPNNKCPVTTAWRSDPVFSKLDFHIDEPNEFQYTIDSDGKDKLTATAVGDPGCSGKPVTYKLELTQQTGNVMSKLTEP